jgi:drug/metabolite transporter (DMT)-like permease
VVYLLAIAADVCLGVGWVLQQQVAATTRTKGDSAWQALRRLIGTPVWWGGIAAMAAGQSLAASALQSGPVTLVEPLLVGCLLCAFGYAAWRCKEPIRAGEVLGTLIVIGGLAMFVGAGRPQAEVRHQPSLMAVVVAASAATAVAGLILFSGQVAGRRRMIAAESAAFAAAAGIFYALQDVATRGAIDVVHGRDWGALVSTCWPYVLLVAAIAGVLLSQAAFREARLDWSLPPTVAMQPIVGVAMGVGLLGEHLRHTGWTLAVEAASLPITLVGVVIVGRSGAIRRAHGLHLHRVLEPERDKQHVASRST